MPNYDKVNNMEKTIVYFEKGGPQNTAKTLHAARRRAEELGIQNVVVASTHGGTALEAMEAFETLKVNLVAVSISGSFRNEGWVMTAAEKEKLTARGIKVLTSVHALGDGVASALTKEFGGRSAEEIVRESFYRFCQGMKVCIEITLMAADAGLLPTDKEIVAIGGTGKGADTCLVVWPAYCREFLKFEIREIVAKPRDLS